MLASTLIGFREALEAALIIGIILAYLLKTRKEKYNNIVYLGITAAIVTSIITAILFNMIAGGFEGQAEQIFEGFAMLFAAGILTYMVIWMQGKSIANDLREKVSEQLSDGQKYGLFFLSFISVFREGVETVLFLSAAKFAGGGENSLLGTLIGIVLAIVLGYLIFVGSKKINIKKFFSVTSFLLILFAAGLFAHGVHEFQEAGWIPIAQEHVWDINPLVNEDGSFPVLHEQGVIGSLMKGLFGYNGNPNLLEVIIWALYLLGMGLYCYKKKD
ncbi:FTR1 family protein [Bacteroidota bacterium]